MTGEQDAWTVHGKPRPSRVTFAPEMKLTEQQMIQRDLDDIEKEMADARRQDFPQKFLMSRRGDIVYRVPEGGLAENGGGSGKGSL